MNISEKTMNRLSATVATFILLCIGLTIALVVARGSLSIASGIQLAMLVVSLYLIVTTQRRHKEFMALSERIKADIATFEVVGAERVELETWRAFSLVTGIQPPGQAPAVETKH